jgi:hypothetical protein
MKILNFIRRKEFLLKFDFLVLTDEKTTGFFNFLSNYFAVSECPFVAFLIFVFKCFIKANCLQFELFFE